MPGRHGLRTRRRRRLQREDAEASARKGAEEARQKYELEQLEALRKPDIDKGGVSQDRRVEADRPREYPKDSTAVAKPQKNAAVAKRGFAVVDGGTVTFGGHLVRLFGIDPPLPQQACDGGKWSPAR